MVGGGVGWWVVGWWVVGWWVVGGRWVGRQDAISGSGGWWGGGWWGGGWFRICSPGTGSSLATARSPLSASHAVCGNDTQEKGSGEW